MEQDYAELLLHQAHETLVRIKRERPPNDKRGEDLLQGAIDAISALRFDAVGRWVS
jgi:hypothetical protein